MILNCLVLIFYAHIDLLYLVALLHIIHIPLCPTVFPQVVGISDAILLSQLPEGHGWGIINYLLWVSVCVSVYHVLEKTLYLIHF